MPTEILVPGRAHGMTLFIAHPAGWGEVSADPPSAGLKVRLKRWAALSGTLVDTNGAPVAGVKLGITMEHDWQSGGPLINVQGETTTDAQGRFQFSDVPPRRLEVQRMIPMPGTGRMSNGWTWQLQTWLFVEPAITNDLGKVTYDTPPPPPMLERVKQTLGL